MIDPFNCPKCGAHDYGLYQPGLGGDCPHCLKQELAQAREDAARLRALHELGWASRDCPVCGASCAGAAIDAARNNAAQAAQSDEGISELDIDPLTHPSYTNAAGVNSEVGQAEILDPSAPAAPEASVVVPRDFLVALQSMCEDNELYGYATDIKRMLAAAPASGPMLGSDTRAPEQPCRGCGAPLLIDNAWMEDGCPCNTPAGVNNHNLYRWRLLHELQQRQSRELEKAKASGPSSCVYPEECRLLGKCIRPEDHDAPEPCSDSEILRLAGRGK